MLGLSFPSLSLLILRGLALIVAAPIHEFAHAYIADRLGDPTPRSQGRLTLNPLAHLDLVGTLFVLLTGFGWAKPVQINPTYFSNWRRDTILVAAAGPLANVTALFILGLPVKLGLIDAQGLAGQLLFAAIVINAGLALFNLLPIPPLDGSKILVGLLPPGPAIAYARLQPYGILLLFAVVFVFPSLVSSLLVQPMDWLIGQATGRGIF